MWQKQLIDWYGYDNIIKFFAANTNNEFNPSNAFENGKVAMMFDGEWRTAFIKRDSIQRSTTALRRSRPLPTIPTMYGSARVGGTIVGIPKGAKHPDQAWLLVKFLASDTTYLVQMANSVGNVPTTHGSEASPDLTLPPQFDTFLHVWANPKSAFAPPTHAVGRRLRQPCWTTSKTSGSPARSVTRRLAVAAGDAGSADRRTSSPRGRRRSNRRPAGAGAYQPRTPAERRRARRRAPLRKYGTVLLLLSPWIIGFVVFTAGPMLLSFYYSFTHYDLISSRRAGSGSTTIGSCSAS